MTDNAENVGMIKEAVAGLKDAVVELRRNQSETKREFMEALHEVRDVTNAVNQSLVGISGDLKSTTKTVEQHAAILDGIEKFKSKGLLTVLGLGTLGGAASGSTLGQWLAKVFSNPV